MNNDIEKGTAEIGRVDAIRRHPHLETRIKRCILTDVIVPKLEHVEEVWEGNV